MKHSLLLNMLRIFVVLSGIMTLTFQSFAQQDPLYGLWLNNPLVINPAYSGINNNLTAFATYRNQWAGFEGSPTTLNAGGHLSLWQNKIGAGFMLVSDKIGENTNTQVSGSLAYKLPINKGTILSFGMQGGFINYKMDPSQLNIQDNTDPLFAPINEIKPNIGVGLMLKNDKYMFGLSAPRLFTGTFDNGGQKITVYQRQVYFMGTYLFFISPTLVLKPAVLLKAADGAPLSTDLNFNLVVDRNFSAGVYTRNFNSYGIMASLNFLSMYRISYALEVPTNQSVGAKFVTNEIMFTIRTAVLGFHDRTVSYF